MRIRRRLNPGQDQRGRLAPRDGQLPQILGQTLRVVRRRRFVGYVGAREVDFHHEREVGVHAADHGLRGGDGGVALGDFGRGAGYGQDDGFGGFEVEGEVMEGGGGDESGEIGREGRGGVA